MDIDIILDLSNLIRYENHNVRKSCNIQFVASILKDKLPEELNHEEFFILKLSQDDKLFRIENYEII